MEHKAASLISVSTSKRNLCPVASGEAVSQKVETERNWSILPPSRSVCVCAVGAVPHRHVSELPAQERHGWATAVWLWLGRGGAQQREEEEQRPPVRRDGGALLPLRHQAGVDDYSPDTQPQVDAQLLHLWLGCLFHIDKELHNHNYDYWQI